VHLSECGGPPSRTLRQKDRKKNGGRTGVPAIPLLFALKRGKRDPSPVRVLLASKRAGEGSPLPVSLPRRISDRKRNKNSGRTFCACYPTPPSRVEKGWGGYHPPRCLLRRIRKGKRKGQKKKAGTPLCPLPCSSQSRRKGLGECFTIPVVCLVTSAAEKKICGHTDAPAVLLLFVSRRGREGTLARSRPVGVKNRQGGIEPCLLASKRGPVPSPVWVVWVEGRWGDSGDLALF
jgi:hypothetical protein